MRACILTIGNEVLKGRTVNTNAAEIGRVLYFSGYEVHRVITVSDEPEEIGWGFRTCVDACDVIISSGGLGPTFDDMTVSSFAGEFSIPLIIHPETYNQIRERFESRGMKMTEEREKMSLIPEGAKVIRNDVGSAPGLEIQLKGKLVFILPGVPREMRPMMEKIGKEIKLDDSFYSEKSFTVEGIPESSIAPISKELMKEYQGKVYIKTHPDKTETGISKIEIEVSAKSEHIEEADSAVNSAIRNIRERIKKLENEK